MTRDLYALALLAVAPLVLRADDPTASVLWLIWFGHAAWLRWRHPVEGGS